MEATRRGCGRGHHANRCDTLVHRPRLDTQSYEVYLMPLLPLSIAFTRALTRLQGSITRVIGPVSDNVLHSNKYDRHGPT